MQNLTRSLPILLLFGVSLISASVLAGDEQTRLIEKIQTLNSHLELIKTAGANERLRDAAIADERAFFINDFAPFLLEYGASLSNIDVFMLVDGRSLLHYVLALEDYDVATILLGSSSSIAVQDLSGRNLLHVLAGNRATKGLREFLQIFVDQMHELHPETDFFTQTDSRGNTPLFVAINRYNFAFANLLANYNQLQFAIPNRDGFYPAGYLIGYRRPDGLPSAEREAYKDLYLKIKRFLTVGVAAIYVVRAHNDSNLTLNNADGRHAKRSREIPTEEQEDAGGTVSPSNMPARKKQKREPVIYSLSSSSSSNANATLPATSHSTEYMMISPADPEGSDLQ